MKKIKDNMSKLLLMLCLIFVTACGNEETNVVNEQKGNSIVSVWKSANERDVLSFAKDGTYKMILCKSENSYYISTGRYSVDDNTVQCVDNCVEGNNKQYAFVLDGDILKIDNQTFKRAESEDNAFENKFDGKVQKYGGYTIGGIGYTSGKVTYFIDFKNSYIAYKEIETIYYNDVSKNKTKRTLMHYVFYDGYLYLAEDGTSYSPKYIVDLNESNCFYYKDANGHVVLP